MKNNSFTKCATCGEPAIGNFSAVLPLCEQCEREISIEADEAETLEREDSFEGWPGDGSGTDDLADYNANEADDYRDE